MKTTKDQTSHQQISLLNLKENISRKRMHTFRQIAEDQEAIYRPSVCGDNCLKASIILIFDITLLP